MKALSTARGVAELEIRELPLPEPGAGEVRVRIRASALNPADQKVLGGEFAGNILHAKQRPLVAGYDLAGTVEGVGPGADLGVGDEVFGFLAYGRATRRGAFAEAVVAPSATLARRPEALTPGIACALATAGATALQALRDVGRLLPGQRVLVVGASGGVGSLAVGVAKKLGANVTGICSASAGDFVRSLGADAVLVRGQDDPLRGAPASYDVVFDPACAYSFGAVRGLLRPGGAYVPTLPSPGLFLAMGIAPLLGKRVGFLTVRSRRADLEQLAAWAADGLKVPIDSTFPVRDVGKALARLARGGMKGRIVIEVAGGF
jgi:NADPH:quinone reductase-like Zn-dependent oxidoreductase